MRLRGSPLLIVSVLVYLFLWSPVLVLMVFSFSQNRFGLRWEGFTLQWYLELLQNSAAKAALTRSITIALVTTVVATLIGTLGAYGLYRFRFRTKRLLRTTILLPIVMPYVVTGAALLTFFTRILRMPLGYPSVILAHITFSLPLAVFIVLGRMQRIDWNLELAAMDLGADRLTTFRTVTGPLLMPGIVASAVLIFPWSFNDFVITYFVAGVGTTTLPIYIFSQLRYGVSPVINVIGTLFVVVTAVSLVAAGRLLREG
jgi:spermidine/putrescine transport system permease protein